VANTGDRRESKRSSVFTLKGSMSFGR
jgi:hypothetical protein